MAKRTKSITAAHAGTFNHYVKLKEMSDLQKWRRWLNDHLGEVDGTSEGMRGDRWGMIGGKVGFHSIDDAKVFIKAANDDCERERKLWTW